MFKLKWVVILLGLLVSLSAISQETEYYTESEIEEMHGRLKELGYSEDFIESSLAPYKERASIKLDKTTFKGKYNKKFQQLMISNCSEVEGEDFCAKYIIVNGNKVEVYCATNHLVYNLRPLDLPIGSEVNIEIYHTPGCTPLVTNPEDFK